MTKFSKVLVVFIVTASLAFMAFAGATLLAGPNWVVESEAEDLQIFRFDLGEGEKPSWSVSEIDGKKETVKTSPVLAETIIAARNKLSQTQQQETTKIDKQLPLYQAKLQEVRKLIELDVVALKKREDELVALLGQMEKEIERLANEVVDRSRKTRETLEKAAQRREDILRLTNQLDIIRADLYKANEQTKLLTDLLYRLRGKVETAQRTREKLIAAGAKLPDDYDPKPDAKSDKDVSQESP